MDSRPAFDMSNQAGISGTTRFVLVYQWAEVDMQVIAVDVKTKEIVWNNKGLKGSGNERIVRVLPQLTDEQKYQDTLSQPAPLIDFRGLQWHYFC